MNQLENYLESIINCLLNIEDRLRVTQKVEEKFIREKKENIARRLVDKAKELIESCNEFLTLTGSN